MTRQSRRLLFEVLGVYALSRLFSLVLLLVVERQLRGARFPGGRAFLLWINAFDRWDAVFYRMAATDGYPRVLPLDENGDVDGSTWAFFPVFPQLAHAVSAISGVGFVPASAIVNILAGAIAAVCLAALVGKDTDEPLVLRTVALWAFFPTAFILLMPYSEAVYAAAASGYLLALTRRRYAIAAVLLLVSALSRGYAVPLSAAALAAVWSAWRESRRSSASVPASGPISVQPTLSFALLASAAFVAPLLWPVVAAVVTGRADAYAVTQQAWGFSFQPADTWVRWRDTIGRFGDDPYFTAVVLTLVGATGAAIATLRLDLPLELRVYTVFSVVFLLAISQPEATAFGSIPRFAFGILTIPLVLARALRKATACAAVLVAYGLLQYWWVYHVWSGSAGVAP